MNIICIAISLGALSVEPNWTPKESEVLPEIENYLRGEYVRSRQIPPKDDDFAKFHRALREEVSVLFGEEAATLNVLFIHAEVDDTRPEELFFQVYLGAILAQPLIEDARKAIKAVAPYWPPENPVLMENIERRFFWPIARTEGQPDRFNIDFSDFIAVLRDAWAVNDHRYDGVVDYMFECNAIMAWLAMLEIEGADEEERDKHFHELIATSHPYGEYYRDKPDRLPAGSREGLHELLVEYSQDDSLWARVFVAEILNKVPYMRDPEIEATLRADPHWLIQRRMAYLDEGKADTDTETATEAGE
jgi:hypothetical protein